MKNAPRARRCATQYDDLEAEYAEAEDLPDEIDRRLGEIEQALEVFDNRPMSFEPEQMARAGVFVSIDIEGRLLVQRGYVRPEDEVAANPDGEDVGGVDSGGVITMGGEAAQSGEDDSDAEVIKPLPERLITELTAYRTLALRDAVAANPHIAMTALLHKLVQDCFGVHVSGCALEARVREVHLAAQSSDLGDSPSAKSIDDRHEAWKADIPLDEDDDRLWTWLDQLDEASRQALLAHCVSFGINALYERPNPYSGMGVSQHGLERRLREADRLTRMTELDLVEAGWRPTVENYLGRVTKSRILEAVREGAGDAAADLIAHLKKGEMAKEAERLLADSGWLPEPLRMVEPDDAAENNGDAQDENDIPLPAFLVGEDDNGGDADQDPEMVAAE